MSALTYDFNGKVALIIGGASGIWVAAVKGFAGAVATIVLADVRVDELMEQAALIEAPSESTGSIRNS